MASSFNPTITGRAMLFPCAAGVQMPIIGVNDTKVKATRSQHVCGGRTTPGQSALALPVTLVPQDSNPVSGKYVKMVSADISFAPEVVEERCLHEMPFNEKYFQDVFSPGELLPAPKRSSHSTGRHNTRGTDVRHMPCYLKKIIKPQPLTPLRRQAREKAQELHKKALIEAAEEIKRRRAARAEAIEREGLSSAVTSLFFLTEAGSDQADTTAAPSRLTSIPEVVTHGRPLCKDISIKSPDYVLKDNRAGRVMSDRAKTKEIIGPKLHDSIIEKTEVSSPASEMGIQSLAATAVKHSLTSTATSLDKHGDWDDHLVSRLSQLTANWVVHERTPGDKQREKLAGLLASYYGQPTHTDLVREQTSDGEDGDKEKEAKPKKKWKKKEASLLARVYNITPPPGVALDPYSDDNDAPFYRQPAGIRKKKRIEEKEEAGAINATAHSIQTHELVETPPPRLRDFLSPRVGDKVYDTDNLYQQERLIGKFQVYTRKDPNYITMETKNRYEKQLQNVMPADPEKWFPTSEQEANSVPSLPKKGIKRWTGLPQPVDDTVNLVKASVPGFDPVYTKPVDPKQRRKVKQNSALITIVNEWRSKWFVSGQFADSTPQDLIKDMADIQSHVRLKAIGTVARATEYKPPQDEGVQLEGAEIDTTVELPEEIFVALECLVDDNHEQVRKAAAITLYSLDRPTEKAKDRLREMLLSQSGIDRWASAQCLAHYGECDSDVVAEIIRQILSCEGAIKYEQGIQLLSKISNSSTLVHCMVAEQLNSSSWRHRVIACKILPTLFGSINRDITQKLSQLMWHDWHVEVRNAAAQCLGKTSHGRDVHNDIRERIMESSERTKLEAINKLGQLGIMTAKLLPAFLQCFADPYVSIRCEVCITCGNLQIKEEQVLHRLVHLATFDPIWKVKALAIQAVGKIGVISEDIKECLIWAMRYEEKEGVRAEACHSLVELGVQDEDVLDALQDRLLVESSELVREEMIAALSQFGLSTTEDMDMVAQIKAEVRKLCTRNIIASQIILNETDETRREQLARMVCQTEADIEALNQKKALILRRIQSQARSIHSKSSSPEPRTPRTSTPVPKVTIGSQSSSPEVMSREATIFTPTADKELEAILSNQEEEDEEGVGESRPMTGVKSAQEEVEKRINEIEKQKSLVIGEDQGDGESANVPVTIDLAGPVPEESDDKVGELTSKPTTAPRLNSDLKHQLDVPGGLLPVSQGSGLITPALSQREPAGSRLSTGHISGRRSILSRDSLKERQRLNAQVSAIYSGLDARYAGMISELCRIDRGLDTKGSSADSSTDNSLNNAMMTSAHIKEAQAHIQAILGEGEGNIAKKNKEASEKETQDGDKAAGDLVSATDGQIHREANATNTVEEAVNTEDGTKKQRKVSKQIAEGDDQDMEWKSFTETLSKDGGENTSFGGSTSYPSFEEDPDDPNVARSYVSTAGLTAQASEYDNNSIVSDNELDEEEPLDTGVLKVF